MSLCNRENEIALTGENPEEMGAALEELIQDVNIVLKFQFSVYIHWLDCKKFFVSE